MSKIGKSENSLANLKPFKPGQCGNPNGRPRLPDTVKARRAFLRHSIEELSPEAIEMAGQVLRDPKADYRDKLRAVEIVLSNALPRQEEVTLDDERPLQQLTDEQVRQQIDRLQSGLTGITPGTGMAA